MVTLREHLSSMDRMSASFAMPVRMVNMQSSMNQIAQQPSRLMSVQGGTSAVAQAIKQQERFHNHVSVKDHLNRLVLQSADVSTCSLDPSVSLSTPGYEPTTERLPDVSKYWAKLKPSFHKGSAWLWDKIKQLLIKALKRIQAAFARKLESFVDNVIVYGILIGIPTSILYWLGWLHPFKPVLNMMYEILSTWT